MEIFIEYVIVFVAVYFVNYLFVVKNKKSKKKREMPPEITYLKKLYKIDIKKLDYDKVVLTYCFVNTFIISTIYIILMYLLNDWILRIIIGIILLILLIIICYGLLGRYYAYKIKRDS